MAIFLIGIPAIRYVFPAAIVLGCGVALVLHFTGMRRQAHLGFVPARRKSSISAS
jgi:hypothetical protein